MKKTSLAEFLIPSIGDVIFLVIMLWSLVLGSGLLNDGDTGWHIVTGESIIRNLQIPHADPYSHTMPGIPWTSHEWLAEVIFAAAHMAAGLNGVVLLTAAVISLSMLAMYNFMFSRGASAFTAAFFTVLGALASSIHWLARPHIFSFPLTLAFIMVLERYQREGKNRLYLLPLLMALWVNLHGGFILGIILLCIYAGGNLLLCFPGVSDAPGREESLGRFKTLAAFTGLTVLATFANPHGPEILYFPFHLVGREYIMNTIQEWLSPDFHKARAFEVMLLVFASVFVLSKRKPDVFEGSSALLLTHMSLYSARYIPLLVFVAGPMAASRADEVAGWLADRVSGVGLIKRVGKRFSEMSGRISSMERRFGRHTWVYICLAAGTTVALSGGTIGDRTLMDYAHRPERFPVDAMRFVEDNGIGGKMFNNDSWGGYIIYRSYPRYRVFFDGRSDMYDVPFLKEYVKVARARPGFEKVLDKYGADWVIFNANSPLCRLLAAEGWGLVYADATADILLRDTKENRPLIEKYSYVKFVPGHNDE